ncbi:1-deoxy-D-xylulose-5-phosphate reductoisomerase [uncultured Desulfobacter sp.]|uniref:1-deoxy-D-xylulose-5-phosphate reductoisomerase n=1 Tax=uncultured Desulfobacter sp. TaxID=240139 RepID=UPI002AABF77E|nr:1-deoxy-D-xylulose-5-phosphate reductoisomerase [uncultured Desulfobacter sp.]
MKSLTILGSTGSIGTSALKVVAMHPDKFNIKCLTCAINIDLLASQIKQFRPAMVAVLDEQSAKRLAKLLSGSFMPEILWGEPGFIAAAQWADSDMVLAAMVGAAGLAPALAAIDAGKTLALANKETLVMAGEIVMARAQEKGVEILPVDSEHCAIFQCLQGNQKRDLKKIFLTASGGPFRNLSHDRFKDITPAQALDHPTWNMGAKISIDSATLMNKALEVIEAVRLFNVSVDQIQVLIHPQSIVHSMVGFKDGGIMAQLGEPDMMHAIAYAFSYPDRMDLNLKFPDFVLMNGLTFDAPDTKRFPSLEFAYEACRRGGTLPAVMNAANEAAVEAFLKKRIGFTDIFRLVSGVMGAHTCIDNPDLSGIIEADCWARGKTQSLIQSLA